MKRKYINLCANDLVIARLDRCVKSAQNKQSEFPMKISRHAMALHLMLAALAELEEKNGWKPIQETRDEYHIIDGEYHGNKN